MAENAIEPSEYSSDQTQPAIESHEMPAWEKEVAGIWEGIQFVDKIAKKRRRAIDEQIIRQIHAKIMHYFHPAVAGKYRDFEVSISKAIVMPSRWTEVKPQMWQFCSDLALKTSVIQQSLAGIEEVVRLGAWAHYRLVRIHPFADGNGRTARLLTDLIFKRAGLYYITDWGSGDDGYINVLRRVDETGDLTHLEQFLAGKLAARHNEVLGEIHKSPIGNIAQDSPVARQIKERREILLQIANGRVSHGVTPNS